MEYIFYVLLIILAVSGLIYFFKRNKGNGPVVYREIKDLDAQDELDREAGKGEPDAQESDAVDSYKMEIINYWVTQKVNPNQRIDYDKLKEKILKVIGALPDVLEDATTRLDQDREKFIWDILGKIEFSSNLKYHFITKARSIASVLRFIFNIGGLIFFILFEIEIRKTTDSYSFLYFVLTLLSLIFEFICKKLSAGILNSMVCKLKPGDYLRMISSPDEVVEKTVKLNPLSNNETVFNKTSSYQSRNRLLCESFLSNSGALENTINNKMCIYLVINYLKEHYSREAYRTYLLEKEINALEFICSFKPESLAANYELCLEYFEAKRYDEFYEGLLKLREVHGYDWIIEAWIKDYEFYLEHCTQKINIIV